MTPDRPDKTLAPLLFMRDDDLARVERENFGNVMVQMLREEIWNQRRLSVEKDATIRASERLRSEDAARHLDALAEKDAALVQARSVIDSLLQSRLDDAIRFDEQSATLARLEQEIATLKADRV